MENQIKNISSAPSKLKYGIQEGILAVAFFQTAGLYFKANKTFALAVVFVSFLSTIIAIVIGKWLGNWYSKRERVNLTFIKVISYANVFTWFLPITPIGFITSSFIYNFIENYPSDFQRRRLFYIISGISMILTDINLIVGLYLNYAK